jgi:hypothetical protein
VIGKSFTQLAAPLFAERLGEARKIRNQFGRARTVLRVVIAATERVMPESKQEHDSRIAPRPCN